MAELSKVTDAPHNVTMARLARVTHRWAVRINNGVVLEGSDGGLHWTNSSIAYVAELDETDERLLSVQDQHELLSAGRLLKHDF